MIPFPIRLSFWRMLMLVCGTILVRDSLISVAKRPLHSYHWIIYIMMTIVLKNRSVTLAFWNVFAPKLPVTFSHGRKPRRKPTTFGRYTCNQISDSTVQTQLRPHLVGSCMTSCPSVRRLNQRSPLHVQHHMNSGHARRIILKQNRYIAHPSHDFNVKCSLLFITKANVISHKVYITDIIFPEELSPDIHHKTYDQRASN